MVLSMKIKFFSLMLSILMLFSVAVPAVCAATEGAEFELTLVVNNRYTDIYFEEELNDPYLNMDSEKEELENKRNIYVAILGVLLVIAVGVLIYTLKKAPNEEALKKTDDEETPKTTIKVMVPKKKTEITLEEEEKKE